MKKFITAIQDGDRNRLAIDIDKILAIEETSEMKVFVVLMITEKRRLGFTLDITFDKFLTGISSL